MKGIVWGLTFKGGVKKLEQIEQGYEMAMIPCLKKIISQTTCELMYENGDYWRVLTAASTGCGFKANVAYIDKKIPQEVIQTVIYPTLVAAPYQAINYF